MDGDTSSGTTDDAAKGPQDGAEEPTTPEADRPDPTEPAEEPEDEPAEEPEDEPAEEPEDEPEDEPSVPDPSDDARRRLLEAVKPRATRSQLLAALVCAVLGFAVVVGTRQTAGQNLASLRESDLVAVLDNVTQQSARLEDQARTLQQTFDGLRTASDRGPAARQAAQERLEVLGVLAGTLPATGPGIELEIPDPNLAVNATEMVETVQELRDAGAEAMQLGSARVVADTAFVDVKQGLQVDGTVVPPTYRLIAVGDPQTLAAAMEIPGGVLEVLRGKGVVGVVHTRESITVTALRTPRPPQYAHPALSAP